jgi:signal transduction histidine kinase
MEESLKRQNEKLNEIALFQSHQIRGPLATVLGLINLLNLEEPCDEVNVEVIPKIEQALKELDKIIHIIEEKSKEIEKGH